MITISSGESQKDRISFYTNNNGITAIKTKYGKIKFEIENPNKPRIKLHINVFCILFLFPIPSLIKLFIIIPLIEEAKISVIWYLFPALCWFLYLINAILSLRKNDGIELLRNHAAEHMVYAAYNKLHRIPSMQESMKFSRISNKCGVMIFSGFIMVQIIGFIFYTCIAFKIPEIVLMLIFITFYNFFPLNLIGKIAQLFTTSKPKPKNLRLAISAVSALEMLENYGEHEILAINNGEWKIQIR